MKLTDEQIDKLISNSRWREVIENLTGIIKTDEATLNNYAAFICAVSKGKYVNCFKAAFACFVQPIINFLGFQFFDEKNSNNIPLNIYYISRFMLFISSTKYNDALMTINKLINIEEKPQYYFQRSKLYSIQRKHKLALEDLNKAIELSANESLLYYHRAIVKQRINDIQGACTDLDNAINIQPNNCDYYILRGTLYENLEHYKNATDDFKKALRINPEKAEAYQEIAWCKYKLNKPSEGIAFINIATRLDEKNPSSYYIKGCLLNALLKYDEAINELEIALSLDNQSDKNWSSKIHYHKALAEFRLKKYNDAQYDINYAIKLNSKDIAFFLLAMDIEYFGLKDYYTAKGHAKTILSMDDHNQRAINAIKEINEIISF